MKETKEYDTDELIEALKREEERLRKALKYLNEMRNTDLKKYFRKITY